MKTNSRFLLAAALWLAMAFTFSCSEQPVNDTGNNNQQGNNQFLLCSLGSNCYTVIDASQCYGQIVSTCSSISPSSSSNNTTSGNGSLPAPTGLSVTRSSTNIQVTWNAVTGASGYKLYYLVSPFTIDWRNVSTLGTTYYTELDDFSSTTSAARSVTYYFKVAAYNANGEGGMSSTVSVTIDLSVGCSGSTCGGGITTPSSSSNNTASVECSGYCKWDNGCVRIATDPTGEYGSVISTCTAAISNCQSYSPSKQVYTTSTCGGSTVTPSSSSVNSSSSSANPNATNGTFTDSRDGKSYKWVKIGTQTWMAENLNYYTGRSKCYENKEANCTKYGRLYPWMLATNSLCPSGWYMPSDGEWALLVDDAGGATAGKKLKTTSGWNVNGNGTDNYGFSALPGGEGSELFNDFAGSGCYGNWWSTSAHDGGVYVHYWEIGCTYEDVKKRSYEQEDLHLLSVRCVKN